EHPFRITARTVHLAGLRLIPDSTHPHVVGGEQGAPVEQPAGRILLAVRTQQLALDHCEFTVPSDGPLATAVAWKIPDEADPSGGHFVARHSTIHGPARALDLHAMPRLIGFDNCLKRGPGPLVRFNSANHSTPLRLSLRQTTLRGAGPVVHWSALAAIKRIQPALLIVENSVIAPLSP